MHLETSNQPVTSLGFGNYTCNWGAHICGLYETTQERDEIILGFLHTGAVQGDLQLYCPVERTEDNFCQTYAETYPQHAAQVYDENVFQLFSAKELYFADGTFSPWDMDAALQAFYAESQKDGKRSVRATAEMVWALKAIPGVEQLMAYEARLNIFIPPKPWISICLYNTSRFDGAIIMQALQTHPYVINSGIITQNPYYIKAEEWLEENAPQYLSH